MFSVYFAKSDKDLDKQYNLEVINAKSLGTFRLVVEKMNSEIHGEREKFKNQIEQAKNSAGVKFKQGYGAGGNSKIKKNAAAIDVLNKEGGYLAKLLRNREFELIEEFRSCMKADFKPEI